MRVATHLLCIDCDRVLWDCRWTWMRMMTHVSVASGVLLLTLLLDDFVFCWSTTRISTTRQSQESILYLKRNGWKKACGHDLLHTLYTRSSCLENTCSTHSMKQLNRNKLEQYSGHRSMRGHSPQSHPVTGPRHNTMDK